MPQERFSRKKKIPRIPTPESLANAALAYVEKYAASEASFRRVLLNKIRRPGKSWYSCRLPPASMLLP